MRGDAAEAGAGTVVRAHRPVLLREAAAPAWRCSECARDLASVNRLRRRRGLPAVMRTQKVCSVECRKARLRRQYAARFGPAKASWPGRKRGW
jgi:hypothetical protein